MKPDIVKTLYPLIVATLFILVYTIVSLFDRRPNSPFRKWLESKRPVLLSYMIVWLCIRYSIPNRYMESTGFRLIVPGFDLAVMLAAFTVLAESIYYKLVVGQSIDNMVRGCGAIILTVGAALPFTDDIMSIYPSNWCLLAVAEAAVILFHMYRLYERN